MGIAKQELNLQFKNPGLQDTAFSPRLTQALYSGKFRNFSPFSIFEVEPLAIADQQNRHLILHFDFKQTRGKSANYIPQNGPPTELFARLCSIFFGDNSIPCEAITALTSLVECNRHILKAREADKRFMSQLHFAVDTRFLLWLDESMTLTTRNQVDNSILNFTPLIENIHFGTFFVQLPSTFITSTNTEPKPRSIGKNAAKQLGDKRDDDDSAG
jgi:hypothetical protein